MQYPQPLQMSSCTTTVSNSVRNSAPVGQTSRQAACSQCLQTSDAISQRSESPSCSVARPPAPSTPTCSALDCSMNATWRHVSAPRSIVLSYDIPVKPCSDSGMSFHSLHATSHALQPMHSDVSVKNPMRGLASAP